MQNIDHFDNTKYLAFNGAGIRKIAIITSAVNTMLEVMKYSNDRKSSMIKLYNLLSLGF